MRTFSDKMYRFDAIFALDPRSSPERDECDPIVSDHMIKGRRVPIVSDHVIKGRRVPIDERGEIHQI